MEKIISIKSVTKDYSENRGNFDINLDVYENEIVGIIGENGAGKTTLIRQLMGFVKPDSGEIKILGYDAYKDAAICKNFIGYVPGEINFPDVKNGNLFLHEYGEKLGVKDFTYANTIIKRLQLDVTAYPKRMSKGMKQKTAIVSALMLQAPIVILDEPTTGLDPLMRDEFLKIVSEQKQKGTTIIMSSNTIEELEKVCTKICFMSKGRLIDVAKKDDIYSIPLKDYEIVFADINALKKTVKDSKFLIKVINESKNLVRFRIDIKDTKQFLNMISKCDIKFINIYPYNLVSYFDDKIQELQGVK